VAIFSLLKGVISGGGPLPWILGAGATAIAGLMITSVILFNKLIDERTASGALLNAVGERDKAIHKANATITLQHFWQNHLKDQMRGDAELLLKRDREIALLSTRAETINISISEIKNDVPEVQKYLDTDIPDDLARCLRQFTASATADTGDYGPPSADRDRAACNPITGLQAYPP
jgi:hypothetical protein